jgi:uncharacterized protein with PIN domain
VIVVDASALLEVLLRAPSAEAVEKRLFATHETLHAPHLLDVEVAQVIRRYAAAREINKEPFQYGAIRTAFCCRGSGNFETALRLMTQSMWRSQRRLMRLC